VAYRHSSLLLAVLVCAATGLLLSPISWLHHYVWIVPALIWLAVGTDRPARGAWWALVAALTFVVPPTAAAGSGPLWFVRDDAYVVATLVFIGLVGVMLWTRLKDGLTSQTHPEGAWLPRPARARGRRRQRELAGSDRPRGPRDLRTRAGPRRRDRPTTPVAASHIRLDDRTPLGRSSMSVSSSQQTRNKGISDRG
jgi:hypothetical protein